MLLEGVSLSSLLVIVYLFNRSSVEAAFKYLIFSILSSGFLLLGISLIFFVSMLTHDTPSLHFSHLAELLYTIKGSNSVVIITGINCILLSFFLKLGVFPLHSWVPDVYEGT